MSKSQLLKAVWFPNLLYMGIVAGLIGAVAIASLFSDSSWSHFLGMISLVSLLGSPFSAGLASGVCHGYLVGAPPSDEPRSPYKICFQAFLVTGFLVVAALAWMLWKIWGEGAAELIGFGLVGFVCLCAIQHSMLWMGAGWGARLRENNYALFFLGRKTPWEQETPDEK